MSVGRIQRGKEFMGSLTSRLSEDYRMSGTLGAERRHLEDEGLLKPDQTILQYSLECLRKKAAKEKDELEQQEAELVFPAAMLAIAENA